MFDLVMKPVHDFITYAASIDLFTMIVSKPDFVAKTAQKKRADFLSFKKPPFSKAAKSVKTETASRRRETKSFKADGRMFV
jgi:competence protein ComEC